MNKWQKTNAKNGHQRKVYLINPKFQLTFVAYLCVMAAFVIGIYYAANWYFLESFMEKGKAVGLPANHVYFDFIRDQEIFMNMVFLVSSVCAFMTLTVIGIWLSHRVAGPLYRLHSHMLKVAEGQKLSKVKFRKKDYFQEIASAYNEQVMALEGKKTTKKAS